jgi:pimeloyl-ACP methyl ester carboxylesterase
MTGKARHWRGLAAFLALAFFSLPAHALELSGTWQADSKPQRVLKITRTAQDWRADFYDVGPELPGAPRYDSVSRITVSGNAVHFALDKAEGTFDGTLSADGKTIAGTWKLLYGPPSQALTFTRTAKKGEWPIDTSAHKARFVTVQPGVKLEVLDWGGNGPPLIFLSGLGSTAHSFDGFAEKFTARHHVYAITRRGFGASSAAPPTDENYDADRLGDDVLAVMETLHIEKPVIAGHSIAGEELSSIGTRHPERIAGLIYLDSINSYSFHDPAVPDLDTDAATVRRDLDRMFDLQPSPAQWSALIKDTQAAMVNLQQSLKDAADTLDGPQMPLDAQSPSDIAGNKIFANVHRYGAAAVPILAIQAMPRRCQPNCDKPFMQKIMAAAAARLDLFEKTAPHARVVRIANANHYIWRSDEAQVEQEMNAFMDRLH